MLSNILPLFSKVLTPKWTVLKNVSYGNLSEQIVDCYLLNEGIRPAIVLIHGGGWMSGDKSAYEGTARRYALAGYNVFAINYRLAKHGQPNTQWDAQIKDVELFIGWLRQNASTFRVDANRIVVAGDSAGAHLSLFLATSKNPTTKVLAVLNMYGPTDLSAPEMQYTLSTTPVLGGSTDTKVLKAASPISYIDSNTSPICIIHGIKDAVVPYSQAQSLKNVLDANAVYNELIPFDGGHGYYTDVPWYMQMYLDARGLWFLNKYV